MRCDKEFEFKKFSPLLGSVVKEPHYASNGAAAMDVYPCIPKPIEIPPKDWVTLDQPGSVEQGKHWGPVVERTPALEQEIHSIPLGFGIAPKEFNKCGILLPRSGKGCKKGIVLRNTIGLIDPDYRGGIVCCVHNDSMQPIILDPQVAFMQLMIIDFVRVTQNWVDEFSEPTDRGCGGFGSTDKR